MTRADETVSQDTTFPTLKFLSSGNVILALRSAGGIPGDLV